mmetsp:Transcript_28152/g.56611  ORF Transcript_28152/g.56611 Transcript_28152/m.56611 type:complete len:295 (+) Transcript_28152:1120-2004(+)
MLVPSMLIFFTMALPCLMTFLSPSPVSSVKSSLYERLIEVSVSFSTKARTSTPTVESSKLQLTRESSVTRLFSSMESNNPSQLASSNPRPSRIRDVREGSLNLRSLMISSISSSLIFFGCSVGCLDVTLCLNVFDDTAAMAPRFHLLVARVDCAELLFKVGCGCGSGFLGCVRLCFNAFVETAATAPRFHLLAARVDCAELLSKVGCGCGSGFLGCVRLCFNAFVETAATAPRFHLLAALVGEDDCICGSGAELTLGCNSDSDSPECRSSYFALISAIRRSFSWRPIDLSFIKD